MTILPLTPWVNTGRKVILWIGLGWPLVAIFLFLTGFIAKRSGLDWVINGIVILTMAISPISLLLALILPTYKSRMVVIPPVLLFVYWMILGRSGVMLLAVPGITTLIAAALLVPQHSTVVFIFRRKFARQRSRAGRQ
jgi:hypothetical protein